jgi:hypothetical protein
LKLDVNRNVTLSNGLYFPGGASIRWTSEFVVSSPAVLTHLGSGHNWLNAAGNAWHMQHDGTKLWVPQSIYSDAQIYCGDGQFFRARGSGGVYWESWGGGWYMTDSTWVRIYGGKWLDTAGGVLTTRGGMIRVGADPNDANHSLAYSSEAAAAIDPGSGVGSNGPKLQGYSTVWLRTAVNGYSFLFYDKNSYLTSAGVYSKFSSRELKDEIEPLDPDRCLSDVARWQPVDYIVKQNPEMGRLDGFIAEDLDEVSPQLVVHTAPGSERENRPHAIDYGALTPRLAGAVQALLRRIEQLEGAA